MTKKVLYFCHGHPKINAGGGEIAAYMMFEEVNRQSPGSAYFVGRQDGSSRAGGEYFSIAGNQNDMLLRSGTDDFTFHQRDGQLLARQLPALLKWIRPDVVHFHHYVHMGLEFLTVVKNELKHAKIVMTLHEYIAICHNSGQMVKTYGNQLCYKSSPSDCSMCFNHISPADFLLRELSFKAYFNLVDIFIAPSYFLRDRYIAWGLPADKIVVIENGQSESVKLPPRNLAVGEKRDRFAFFGQLTPFKGVDVLIDAMARLGDMVGGESSSLRIHGANLQYQPEFFQEAIKDSLKRSGSRTTMYGKYTSAELQSLMSEIDWVIVPSIWWENSPLVIQEALKFGRPLIVSGIGGMAEKVQNGVFGLHVPPGSPQALADAMLLATATNDLWQSFYDNIMPPTSLAAAVAETRDFYEKVHEETAQSSVLIEQKGVVAQ
jgi:glycosyltransferase involved in cell wall biosynthesis